MLRSSIAALLAATCVIGASASGYFSFASDFGVPGRNASYDCMVVGGGIGGLTIAMRLAETLRIELQLSKPEDSTKSTMEIRALSHGWDTQLHSKAPITSRLSIGML
jgi:hypothetical protein